MSDSKYSEKYLKNSTILGKHAFLPIDFKNALNDNVVVLGSSGTGKTYSFVKPNILQMNMNYVVADAKGEILADTGETLKQNGYDIRVLNLVDLQHSMSYNPLKYMENDIDILSFAHSVITSTPDGSKRGGSSDPFWDNAPQELLVALISFVQEFLPEEDCNMNSVIDLFNAIDKPAFDDADMDMIENHLGYQLFEWARSQNPNSYAVRKWDSLIGVGGSPRTWSSIVGILGAALAPYEMRDVVNLMYDDSLDFSTLLKPKTALFVMYDDADNSKNFISNVFYKQLFAFLFHKSREFAHQSLPVKIRFFLDDFKNVTIPGFDDYLATARSRNLSVCIMLQDESQLRAKYKDNAPSIIGNCATYLLTGTTDLTMAKEASERFNMTANQIRQLDRGKFLIDMAGEINADDRYDFKMHPSYVDQVYHLSKEMTIENHLPEDKLDYKARSLDKIIDGVLKAQQQASEAYTVPAHIVNGRKTVTDGYFESQVGTLLMDYLKTSPMQVWPQMHLNSLIDTDAEMSFEQARKNQAMSVDYVIGLVQKDKLVPLLAVEVDGPSHFTDARQAFNDEYKNRELEQAKLPLLRVSDISSYVIDRQGEVLDKVGELLKKKLTGKLTTTDYINYMYDQENRNSMYIVEAKKLSNQELFDKVFRG